MNKIKEFLREIDFLQTNPTRSICPLEEGECFDPKDKKKIENSCSSIYGDCPLSSISEDCPLCRIYNIIREDR